MHRLLLCATGVVALYLTLDAWDRLVAYTYYHQAQVLKSSWHEANSVPHDRDLNESFKLGYAASELESDSAEYRFALASLHAWRERGLRLWPQQAKAEHGKIIQSLKAALARRPSWHDAWILLALIKYQRGEVDHEFRVALEKAVETGRYETSVHHGLAIIGLPTLDGLDRQLSAQIIETLRIALTNRSVSRFVVERIVMSRNEELFRKQLESDDHLNKLTQRYIEKRNKAL